MRLRVHIIIQMAGYKGWFDALTIGDGLIYVDTKHSARLLQKYLNWKYKPHRFWVEWVDELGEITLYCSDIPLEQFREIKGFCSMIISHNQEGERIMPVQGLFKTEGAENAVRIHARNITMINRPMRGTLGHQRYMEKLKNKPNDNTRN